MLQDKKRKKRNVTTRGKSFNIEYNSFGRGLVMASLNINSLLAHIDELRVFMSNSKIDILSINETKLDSISDHALIYMTHKAHYERSGTITIKTRQLKHFHKVKFLRDSQQKAWSNVKTLKGPESATPLLLFTV